MGVALVTNRVMNSCQGYAVFAIHFTVFKSHLTSCILLTRQSALVLKRSIPTHFLNFNYSSLFAFYTYLRKYIVCIINQSVFAFQAPKNVIGTYFLQVLVNKSVNMAKQLFYSELHSKSICLSYVSFTM